MKTFLNLIAEILVLLVVTAGAIFYFRPLWVADQVLRFKLHQSGVKSSYVTAGGYRLHYLEARPPHPGGPDHPILLIHGLGSRGEDWSPLIPGLAAAGFHVYALDLLGYGRSPQPNVDYSMRLETETVLNFMEAMHLTHADVAGWSMGGWIAMKLAADYPDVVDRLLLYDSAGVYFPPTFDLNLFAPTDHAGLARLLRAISPKPRTMPSFVQDDAIRRLTRNGWIVNRSMSAMVSGRDLMDFRLRLIHQPTLIIWGSHDDLIPLSAGLRIHGDIEQSSLVIMDGCGHLAPAECWKPVEKATLDFLKQQPAPQRSEKTIPNADRQ